MVKSTEVQEERINQMAFKFIKTGEESVKMAQKAHMEAEQKKESFGKLWRFGLNEGESAKLTFIDGDLSPEGFLIPPRWYEHRLYLNGSWNNFFVCPAKTNPDANDTCPICESGDEPDLVSAFTIIDHRTSVSKKGTSYSDTKKLFIAKRKTFEMLSKIAMKRGGLAGATFEATRDSKTDAGVGNRFDFEEKRPIAQLMQLYVFEKTDPKTNTKTVVSKFTPADYESEIIYRTGDELRKMGFGKPTIGAPMMASPGGSAPAGDTDYSSLL